MNKLKDADFRLKKVWNVHLTRMSISLRKEQGFHFTRRISSKMSISSCIHFVRTPKFWPQRCSGQWKINLITSLMVKNHHLDKYIFFDKRDRSFMSRTAITSKFKMHCFFFAWKPSVNSADRLSLLRNAWVSIHLHVRWSQKFKTIPIIPNWNNINAK